MKNQILKLLALLLIIYVPISSCTKDPVEIILTIFATHSDYDALMAANASIDAISVDGVNATYDFDNWSNITVGETREIQISVDVENEDVSTVNISYYGVGTGLSKETSTSGVKNGDILDLDMATNTLSVRGESGGNGGGGSGTDCSNYYDFYDCGGNPAYMKIKLCKLSETSTTVTVSVDLQPNNGGLVGSSDNSMQIFYGENTYETTYGDFNANGFSVSSITIDKTFEYLGDTYIWDNEYNVYINQTTGAAKVTGIIVVWC